MSDYLDEIITEGGLRQEAKRWRAKADAAEPRLYSAIAFIQAEYETKLECVCVLRGGKPDRSTVDPMALEHVEEFESILAKLEARKP